MTKFELIELLEDVPDDAEIEIDKDGITYAVDPLDVVYDKHDNCISIGGV